MSPQDFEQIGGALLHELGQNPTTGEFSLAKFVTDFDKLAPRAKAIMFSQRHLHDIESIVGMGRHIKGALREWNTSHTAGVLILFDLARDAAMLAATVGTGALTVGVVVGAVPGAAAVGLAHWLASPAKAASMAAWQRAYRSVQGRPSPAQIASFNIATRNLANNLGVPAEQILKRVAAAQPQSDNPQPSPPRPLDQSVR